MRPIHLSLSTIPPRFNDLGKVLRPLLQQSAKIASVTVYVPKSYRRFPDHAFCLPDVPDGVSVEVIDTDLGPATKILPASKRFRGQDVDLLFCDDDRFYEPDWAARFVEERKSHPDDCLCNSGILLDHPKHITGVNYFGGKKPRAQRATGIDTLEYRFARLKQMIKERRISIPSVEKPNRILFSTSGYVDMFEGYGGVMVKPNHFDDTAFEIPEKIWMVDDVWLSGNLEKMGVKIWLMGKWKYSPYPFTGDDSALYKAVIEGMNRRQADLACVKHMQDAFGVWVDGKPPN
jgi:hypothetical protein